jgi:hypothetical protein
MPHTMNNVSILTIVTGLELSHFGLPYQVKVTTYISAFYNQNLKRIFGKKAILENSHLNYVLWLFRILLNDGVLEDKFVSYGIFFTIQQVIIQVVEQPPPLQP